MNQPAPLELDYRGLITPKGIIAVVVRNPRLIRPIALMSTGKTWEELQLLGWTQKPVAVTVLDIENELVQK